MVSVVHDASIKRRRRHSEINTRLYMVTNALCTYTVVDLHTGCTRKTATKCCTEVLSQMG